MYKIMLIYNLYFSHIHACRKNSRKVGNLKLVLCYIRKTVPGMTSLEALALPPFPWVKALMQPTQYWYSMGCVPCRICYEETGSGLAGVLP
jgi:hypothetical protein